MIVSDAFDSDSDNTGGNSVFSESSNDDYDDKLENLYNFWRLEMCNSIKKWNGAKLKKDITSVFYNLTLISGALSHDDILELIMVIADHFRDSHSIGACHSKMLI